MLGTELGAELGAGPVSGCALSCWSGAGAEILAKAARLLTDLLNMVRAALQLVARIAIWILVHTSPGLEAGFGAGPD